MGTTTLVDWAGGIDTNHFVDSVENTIGLDGQEYSTLDPDNPTDNSRLEFQWVLYRESTMFQANVSLKAREPPVGSNGVLDINDAGFTNATLGIKVQVTVP